jgi:hypothetical protein
MMTLNSSPRCSPRTRTGLASSTRMTYRSLCRIRMTTLGIYSSKT